VKKRSFHAAEYLSAKNKKEESRTEREESQLEIMKNLSFPTRELLSAME
jgi:hypothetical protein